MGRGGIAVLQIVVVDSSHVGHFVPSVVGVVTAVNPVFIFNESGMAICSTVTGGEIGMRIDWIFPFEIVNVGGAVAGEEKSLKENCNRAPPTASGFVILIEPE